VVIIVFDSGIIQTQKTLGLHTRVTKDFWICCNFAEDV